MFIAVDLEIGSFAGQRSRLLDFRIATQPQLPQENSSLLAVFRCFIASAGNISLISLNKKYFRKLYLTACRGEYLRAPGVRGSGGGTVEGISPLPGRGAMRRTCSQGPLARALISINVVLAESKHSQVPHDGAIASSPQLEPYVRRTQSSLLLLKRHASSHNICGRDSFPSSHNDLAMYPAKQPESLRVVTDDFRNRK
jgi:hypothetical protein